MIKNKLKSTSSAFRPGFILNKTYNGVLLGGFICALLTATSHRALANEDQSLSTPQLKKLADAFVSKIGQGFDKADAQMDFLEQKALKASNARVQFLNTGRSGDTIPPGEELLMSILVGEHNLVLPLDVIAVKADNDIRISLTDFFSAADIAIKVNSDNGTASGWFIRENQNFYLDMPNKQVTIVDKVFPIDLSQVTIKNNDLFVTSYTLSQWFDLRFIHDFTELAIHIKTSQPLPIEERYARRNKNTPRHSRLSTPVLAEKKQPYKAFSIPQSEMTSRYSYFKFSDNPGLLRTNWSAISSGEVAYHGLESFVTGNDQDLINIARFTLKKEDQDPVLLGKLKARQYAFGDVHTTRLPLTGASRQELGVSVSNKSATASTTADTTDFLGDGTPGWEIELYRDTVFIGFQEIENDGKYAFTNVNLFLGENNFKLIFYGPQGEIQVKEETINVTQDVLASGKIQYEFSASSNNSESFNSTRIDFENNDKPHFVGKVAKQINSNLSLNAGFRSRQEEDQQRTYILGGFSTRIKNTLLNTKIAQELNESGTAIELVARRKIGEHSFRSRVQFNNAAYNPGKTGEGDVIVAKGDITLNGQLNSFMGIRPSYTFGTNFQTFESGANNYRISNSFNTRIANMTFNKSFSYRFDEDLEGNTTDTVQGALNAQGFIGKARWRMLGAYDISPTTELRNLLANVNYPITHKLKGRFEVLHDFAPARTESTVSLDWQHEKVAIAPRLTLDTDNKVQASLNTRVGLGFEPTSATFDLHNKSLATSGSVSARIFLDQNGDGIFDEGDELLPDVELDAVQSRRSAMSDQNGIAHIPDMPRGRLTDVRIDRDSFADPFWASVYEGFSVRPRSGVNTSVDFPVVVSGEIDGTVSLKDSGGLTRAANSYTLRLFTPTGRLAQGTKTSYDGFYIFNNILPGTYYLAVDNADAKATGYTAPPPKKIIIEPNGTTIYGHDIVLNRGNHVNYSLSSNKMVKPHPLSTITPEGNVTPSLVIGEYKSRLAMTLGWFNLKRKMKSVARELELEVPLAQIQRNPETARYHIKTKLQQPNLQKAIDLCKLLASQNYDCTVDLYTKFPQQAAGSTSEKPS